MIKFSQITNKLPYPKNIAGVLSSYHAAIVQYAINHFDGTAKFKKSIVNLLNTFTYMVINHDTISPGCTVDDPFNGIDVKNFEVDTYGLSDDLIVHYKDVDWDIDIKECSDVTFSAETKSNKFHKIDRSNNDTNVDTVEQASNIIISPTSKDSLYLRPPVVPAVDFSRIYMSGEVDGNQLVIYYTLPDIPTNQNEISITTDVNKMTSKELLNLYPNCPIQTRYQTMYCYMPGVQYDKILGNIIPVNGFTEDQVRDNIIKYPHYYRMYRNIGGELEAFYRQIEIDGELVPTLQIWDDLPESKILPRNIEVMKDYVVRRYLLERDVKHIKHKYPLVGEFRPFLTLFMPIEDYVKYGYIDVEDIARQCVAARVAFKQSHSPIFRRLIDNA